VGRAVVALESEGFDHLTLLPEVTMEGLVPRLFMASFWGLFGIFAQPWRARNPRSRCFIGVGAFNLIRAEVYRRIGTHSAIAMRPDDDYKLGKLV
jgi:hypothetical protein